MLYEGGEGVYGRGIQRAVTRDPLLEVSDIDEDEIGE
jgi:hypothetical protein